MNRRNRYVFGSIAAVVVVAGGVFLWRQYQVRAQIAHVEQLRNDIMSPKTRELPPEERREKFEKLRTEFEKLPKTNQKELWSRNPFQQSIDRYFDLPEEEKTAYLDRMIDEGEKRFKEFRERAAKNKAEGKRPQGPPGGPFGGRQATGEQRNEWRQKMLDNSSPQQRAKFTKFFEDMRNRRQERGLPPFPWSR
ncbi:hypothetical protein Pan216_05430 [Planctomycetes bacterium Pan216]|uniref:Uncharacterized protein n=1 Tax=Kolteria novifilia TaxID=2527975 RepID=A0A518AYA6_9BACT|nr:hypothetical protein Pan216_05430 [Planctomycetes bacterium Pan216]